MHSFIHCAEIKSAFALQRFTNDSTFTAGNALNDSFHFAHRLRVRRCFRLHWNSKYSVAFAARFAVCCHKDIHEAVARDTEIERLKHFKERMSAVGKALENPEPAKTAEVIDEHLLGRYELNSTVDRNAAALCF